jgi:hypothetical protein
VKANGATFQCFENQRPLEERGETRLFSNPRDFCFVCGLDQNTENAC